jgi:nitroreductase
MEFQEVVRRRRMVRGFDSRPLPRDAVERIIANAQRGPSSGFSQGFDFLVFDGPDQTSRFWAATPFAEGPYLAQARTAPLIIVPVANPEPYVTRYRKLGLRETAEDFPAPYWYTDTSFAAMLVLLSAVDAGLGAFYFSVGPTSREIPAFCLALGIPEGHHPIGAIAIGYPAKDDPSRTRETKQRLSSERRTSGSMLHFGRWGEHTPATEGAK